MNNKATSVQNPVEIETDSIEILYYKYMHTYYLVQQFD